MTRRYDGPRLTHGKVHYPGKAGHLNQATSASRPKLAHGAVSDPNGTFAGSIKPGMKLPAKAAQPTANMLPQNVGKGPGPAPTPRAPEPRHSVMKAPEHGQRRVEKAQIDKATLMPKPDPSSPVNRKKALIMRERAQEARATQAQGLAQERAQDKQQAPRASGGPPPAPPSAQGGLGQPLGDARRGFGKDRANAMKQPTGLRGPFR